MYLKEKKKPFEEMKGGNLFINKTYGGLRSPGFAITRSLEKEFRTIEKGAACLQSKMKVE